MDRVSELSSAVLILIRVGVVVRVTYIFFGMIHNEDEVGAGKKRIKNILKFYVLAESIFILKEIILSYYGR